MRNAMLLVVGVLVVARADVTPMTVRVTPALSAPTEPAPLLVVLHGNHEVASERAAKWQAAATRRGWRLLALDCPRDRGCNADGQWYAWDGSPTWIFERVRELSARERIDPDHIYLAGWSGGATYIGKRMPEWPRMFAGVVIHGGGTAPRDRTCPRRPLPVYFLVGDENPAHGAAVQLRTYLERCGQVVRWDLLRGADHRAEDAALTPEKADVILRWLEQSEFLAADAGEAWHGL